MNSFVDNYIYILKWNILYITLKYIVAYIIDN